MADGQTPIRWGRIVIRAGLALVVLGVLYVLVTFVQVWRATDGDSVQAADAVVVLGAAQYDGVPSPVFERRLQRAYALYADGFVSVIVTTGANQEGDRFTQGFAGYEFLRDLGVPDEDLLVVTDGSNTYEELSATALVLDQRGLETVLLVSDPYHSLRLAQTADEVGLDSRVVPTDGGSSFGQLVRETAAVSVGRLIGFRRLSSWF